MGTGGHARSRRWGIDEVLLHAKFIRPFVQTSKTDAADARAIWMAVLQPGMRTVAAKTQAQQAMLSLHRIRSLPVKFRTMQVNQLLGLLYEFGVSFRAGVFPAAIRRAATAVRCSPRRARSGPN